MTQLFPRIRRVAAAVTISPRMVAVLAAAWHFAKRLNAPLLVIHGGAPDAQKEAEFRDAMLQLEMPRETRIVWNEGEPAEAIVTAAEKDGVDLLIAGALEGKDVASRSFLGAVAQPLAKLASCSVLLLTHPQIGPNPFRRIVVITDFSDSAKRALKNALWLAEADSAERVQVISVHTPFMQARAELGAEYENRRARAKKKNSCCAILWRQRRRAPFLSNPKSSIRRPALARAILRNQSVPNCSSCQSPSTSKAPCPR